MSRKSLSTTCTDPDCKQRTSADYVCGKTAGIERNSLDSAGLCGKGKTSGPAEFWLPFPGLSQNHPATPIFDLGAILRPRVGLGGLSALVNPAESQTCPNPPLHRPSIALTFLVTQTRRIPKVLNQVRITSILIASMFLFLAVPIWSAATPLILSTAVNYSTHQISITGGSFSPA